MCASQEPTSLTQGLLSSQIRSSTYHSQKLITKIFEKFEVVFPLPRLRNRNLGQRDGPAVKGQAHNQKHKK